MSTDDPKSYGFQGIRSLDRFFLERRADVEAKFLLPFLEPGQSLVDIGCGLGTITVGLAQAVSPGRVLGFDIQEDHLARAQTLAGDVGLTNVSFLTGNVLSPPCDVECFHVAFAHMVVMHLAEPVEALRAVKAILKPGGIIALRDRGGEAVFTGHGADAAARGFDVQSDTAQATGGSPYGRHTGEVHNRLCREAGFEQINVTASWWVARAADVGHPLSAQLTERAIRLGVVSESECREVMSTIETEWVTDPDALFAVPFFEVVARKP